MGGLQRWGWRRHPLLPSGRLGRQRDGRFHTDQVEAHLVEQRQRDVALQVLAEVAELPPATAATALAYVRQLRNSHTAAVHPTGHEPVAPPPAYPRAGSHDGWPPALHQLCPPADRLLDPAFGSATPPDQADVVVHALGPLHVEVARTPVRAWGGTRVRTAFEYLLLHRKPVHREVLMELIWPGYPYRSARNNLNVCIYGLRRALDIDGCRDYVVHRDGYYQLNSQLAWSVDYARFVHAAARSQRAAATGQPNLAAIEAQKAIDEYHGHLFDSDPNTDWCATERASLADTYAQTLELLAELHLRRGEIDAAQHTTQRLLDHDGCRESAHRLLMICYATQNQNDKIARQYRRCVTRLHDELDVAPSTETVRLFHRLTGLR
jgi:DNA-binding SARP family transcriptional activator